MTTGPIVSQFLVSDFEIDSIDVEPKAAPLFPRMDYMTSFRSWLDVQVCTHTVSSAVGRFAGLKFEVEYRGCHIVLLSSNAKKLSLWRSSVFLTLAMRYQVLHISCLKAQDVGRGRAASHNHSMHTHT